MRHATKRTLCCVTITRTTDPDEGGYSELLAVNAWNLLKIPEGVDINDAAFLEPTSVLVHAMRKSGLWEASRQKVLIIGSGFLGLILAQILATRNAGHEIWVTDRNAFKLDMLPASVNKAASPDYIKGQIFDTVFEGTGGAEGVGVAIDNVGRSGTICLLGNPSADVSIGQNRFGQLLRKKCGVRDLGIRHFAMIPTTTGHMFSLLCNRA